MSCCLLEDRAIKFVFFDSNGGSSFCHIQKELPTCLHGWLPDISNSNELKLVQQS